MIETIMAIGTMIMYSSQSINNCIDITNNSNNQSAVYEGMFIPHNYPNDYFDKYCINQSSESYNIPSININYTGDLKNSMKKDKNLDKLQSFKDLNDNWDSYGAPKISEGVIESAKEIILALRIQPEVFPTACNSIQLEYTLDNGNYLEFEVFDKKVEVYKVINDDEQEYTIDKDKIVDICQEVEDFHNHG